MDGGSNGTGSPSSRFKVDVPTGLDESIPMKSPTPPPPPVASEPEPDTCESSVVGTPPPAYAEKAPLHTGAGGCHAMGPPAIVMQAASPLPQAKFGGGGDHEEDDPESPHVIEPRNPIVTGVPSIELPDGKQGSFKGDGFACHHSNI